jgi:hypothetical protein
MHYRSEFRSIAFDDSGEPCALQYRIAFAKTSPASSSSSSCRIMKSSRALARRTASATTCRIGLPPLIFPAFASTAYVWL